MITTTSPRPSAAPYLLAALAAAWMLAVVLASVGGALAALAHAFMPGYALLVALGIGAPVALYYASPSAREAVDALGLRKLTLMHAWRIPAALLFFYYGVQGRLPTPFWVLAGAGDFLAGLFAASLLFGRPTEADYRRVHRFGFTDFVVAVGTGLTFTLLGDARMALLTTLPMALIPLFGVGLSGASHIIALTSLLRRRAA